MLASVATVAGTWGVDHVVLSSPQPGRKKGFYIACILLNVCLHVLPGATAAISKSNFIQWLDTVIQGLTKYDSLVYARPNREWGFYHRILMKEFLSIISVLSAAFQQWGREIVQPTVTLVAVATTLVVQEVGA